uniref:BZIP domain-containing protein n=1 Tax=Parastrongyloides trichosuri TaxID=131310 RepID=A0A0N5A391_PARTI
MAAPPSADDLIQRSFFSSIFNVRLKPNKVFQYPVNSNRGNYRELTHQHQDNEKKLTFNSQTSNFVVPISTTPTDNYSQNFSNQLPATSINSNVNSEIYEPAITLSNNFADNLFVASPRELSADIMSPQEIYNEIIHESAEFESCPFANFQSTEFEHCPFSNFNNQYYDQPVNNLRIQQPMHHVLPTIQQEQTNIPMTQNDNNNYSSNYYPVQTSIEPSETSYQIAEVNSHVAQQISECITPYINIDQNINLEQIIKIVVATMKESSVIPFFGNTLKSHSSKKNIQNVEPPEVILQRKRQQNNEAAARYRLRQKEAKKKFDNEINLVKEKNFFLKKQIASLENEIKLIENVLLNNKR